MDMDYTKYSDMNISSTTPDHHWTTYHNMKNISPASNYCILINVSASSEFKSKSAEIGIQVAYCVCTAVMSCLSVFGSVLILYYYNTIKQLQNRSRQLLVNLTICDLAIAVGNLLGIIILVSMYKPYPKENPRHWLCQIQAAICSALSIASFFWTSFIGLNVFLTVIYNSKVLIEKYLILVHISSWGVPLVVTVITFIRQRFGYNPCVEYVWFCWVTPHHGDDTTDVVLWQLFTGKIWELTSYIIVCALYGAVKYQLYSHTKRMEISHRSSVMSESGHSRLLSTQSSSYILANKKLTYIPLVFILSRMWGSFRFLLLLSDNHYVQDLALVLASLQGLGDSAQGFFNCWVFMSTTPCLRSKFPVRYILDQSSYDPINDDRHDNNAGRNRKPHVVRRQPTIGDGSSSSDSGDDNCSHIINPDGTEW